MGRCSSRDKIARLQKKVSHVTLRVTPGADDSLGKAPLKSDHIIFL